MPEPIRRRDERGMMPTAADELILTGDPHQLLTARQAAVFLSMSIEMLGERRRRGEIRATRVGGDPSGIRYQVAELHRYIDEHTS